MRRLTNELGEFKSDENLPNKIRNLRSFKRIITVEKLSNYCAYGLQIFTKRVLQVVLVMVMFQKASQKIQFSQNLTCNFYKNVSLIVIPTKLITNTLLSHCAALVKMKNKN